MARQKHLNRSGGDHFTEEDGHQLAADMLRELETHYHERGTLIEAWPESMDSEIGDFWKKDKSEILRRYLATMGAKGSPALEHGFFAVLTDVLASQCDGSASWENYAGATRDG